MKNKIIKVLFFYVLFLMISNNMTVASAEDIIVGIYQNPPLVDVDENNEAYGFFVDLMNYVKDEENLNVTYKFDTLENSFQNLENGEIDLLLAIAYSGTRDEKYIYNTETVYTNWGQIYSNKKNTINSFLDLENMSIGVEKGDIHFIGENGIKKTLNDFGVSANFIEYPKRVEMLKDLEDQKIDAVVVSRLFGEFYESNYDIKLTPIQFNPIKIRVIASNPDNQYLLELFDKHMIELKNTPNSIYNHSLNNLLRKDAQPSLPENAKGVLIILITALFASAVTMVIGKRIIDNQRVKLIEQNQKLKEIVIHISELTNIKNMDKLFETLTNQIRNILNNKNVELVNLIEYDDGIYMDSKEYITETYKDFQLTKLGKVNLKYCDESDFLKLKKTNKKIYFDDFSIIVNYHSSYNRQGFLYIEVGKYIDDKELLQIYLVEVMTNLQKIISNIKRTEEKTKLFISLGELIEKRDYQVANHVKRVSEATKILAEACGYSGEQLNNIVIASSVHDIGKIFVPDSLLNKKGKLTKKEFEIIKTHATDDLKMMDDIGERLSHTVHNVVRYHHENWDGSGYPEGLVGEDIPYDARIVSVIDVFEALTHKRPYKRAWSFDEALKFIVENNGKKFDPQIVQTFDRISKRIYDVFRIYKDPN